MANNKLDPCELMVQADCLITDYSSIYFDYMVLDRPIIFFAFDKDDYLKERELYFDYEKYTPGAKAYEFLQLLTAIEDVCQGNDTALSMRRSINGIFGSISGSSSLNIYNRICLGIKVNELN